jgi:hypothetical protein
MRAVAAEYYVTKNIDLSELKFKIKMAFESIMEGSESFNPRLSGQYSCDA